jgi:hypothetical protein
MSKAAAGQKTFSADCVAVLLMALGSTSISKKQLEMMSALDGTRTVDSFQHQFRPIIAKAKQLKQRVDDGEHFEPVIPSARRGRFCSLSDRLGHTDMIYYVGVTNTPDTPKKPRRKANSETPSKRAKTGKHAGVKRKACGMEAEEEVAQYADDQVARYAHDDGDDDECFFPEFIKKEEMTEGEGLV